MDTIGDAKHSVKQITGVSSGEKSRTRVWDGQVRSTETRFSYVHVPPLPLLNKHFLLDGKTTVMLEASPTGSKLAETIGALQCASRKLA